MLFTRTEGPQADRLWSLGARESSKLRRLTPRMSKKADFRNYSHLNATSGSACVARRAGITADRKATAVNIRPAAANVSGSNGWMPKSRAARKRDATIVPTNPIPAPATTGDVER